MMIYLLSGSKGLSPAAQVFAVVATKENENIFAYGHFCVANSRGVIRFASILWRDYHINKWSFSSTYLYGGSRGARTPDLLGVNEAL